MPAWLIPAAIAAASAIGGLFGKQKAKTTTNINRLTMPEYDPKQLAFRNAIIDRYGYMLDDNGAFDTAYTKTGLKSIAKNSETLQNAIGDVLSSRGIGRTGAGGSAMLDTSYGVSKDISDFLLKSVLDLDQRRQGVLSSAASFSSSLPTGSRTTGTDVSEQESGAGGWTGLIRGLTTGVAGVLGTKYASDQLGEALKNIPSPILNVNQTSTPTFMPTSTPMFMPTYTPLNPVMGPSSGYGLKGIYNPFMYRFE